MRTGKSKKESVQIYRPPSIRQCDNSGNNTSGNAISSKLNINAKEFVMTGNIDENRINYSNFVPTNFTNMLSRSKTEIMHPHLNKQFQINGNTNPYSDNLSIRYNNRPNLRQASGFHRYNIHRTKSTGNMLMMNNANNITSHVKLQNLQPNSQCPDDILEKSMSLDEANFDDFTVFPEKYHKLIKRALENVNKLDEDKRVVLGRAVVEQAISDENLTFVASKLSVHLYKTDDSGSFFDSLLNTCQMFYHKKKRYFSTDFDKFIRFISFLLEMYIHLKRCVPRQQLLSELHPKIRFLSLLALCCEDILSDQKHSLREIECVDRVITSTGYDMEVHMRSKFNVLFSYITNSLLVGKDEAGVLKILLKLLELKTANWQLPVSALNYYYPKLS